MKSTDKGSKKILIYGFQNISPAVSFYFNSCTLKIHETYMRGMRLSQNHLRFTKKQC